VRAAKEFALSTGGLEGGQVSVIEGGREPGPAVTEVPAQETASAPAEGEFGVEWGQAIHELLELAMRHPDADLLPWARTVLAESDIDRVHAGAAADTVASVTGSDIWKRALASGRRLTEVPFHIMLDYTEPPTLIRGAIDLVFSEGNGWVLIDFKTDTVSSPGDAEALMSKYAPQLRLYGQAWEACTGEKIVEAGLYFVRSGEFRSVDCMPS
jgi:ATP-dependent helicase/nuclease subunit A